jgi:large subunit ribosomal protein L18
MALTKLESRERRKLRIRKHVDGTTERPRLSIFRSARHIYAQVIDDTSGATLASASTLSKDLRGGLGEGNKTVAAKKVGALVAQQCKTRGIAKVVFDRNGYLYHGRVKALAEAAREAGLDF